MSKNLKVKPKDIRKIRERIQKIKNINLFLLLFNPDQMPITSSNF